MRSATQTRISPARTRPTLLARVYGFTDADGTRPDAWRHVAEVERAGLPADDTGHR